MPDGINAFASLFPARTLDKGMGQAVAERTILRRKADGSFETWGDVAARVADGNALLCPPNAVRPYITERAFLQKHIAKATLLMSGRHLQHGDETQPHRNQEVFTNCSTAPLSSLLFLLLLNGSGVGRAYDDDMALIDWNNAPNLRLVIDTAHPDFDWSGDEDVRSARHKYAGETVRWHTVEDSREGWAKAVEVWETMAYQKVYGDHTLVLDFSQVRAKGAPINGMQGRPASGPKPLMDALRKCATIKGAGMKPWMQALYIDHYLAECVLVGGARRAARMATKWWRDRNILDFVRVKRPIEYAGMSMDEVVAYRNQLSAAKQTPPFAFLWSSNNSVTVDDEFWSLVKQAKALVDSGDGHHMTKLQAHAWEVIMAICESSYGDGTGEPGLINVAKLRQNDAGWHGLEDGNFVGSKKYQVDDETRLVLARLAKVAGKKKYHQITNPCVTADTMVMTTQGPRPVRDLIGQPFYAVVDGAPYASTGFWSTGVKPVFKVQTGRGYAVRATGNHEVLVEVDRRRRLDGSFNIIHAWKRVDKLVPGDRMVLSDNSEFNVEGRVGDFLKGWALGQIKGDGGHNPDATGGTYMRFWGESQAHMASIACQAVLSLEPSGQFKGACYNQANDTTTVKSVTLGYLAGPYMEPKTKELTPCLEKQGSAFVTGFLRGMFDADGSVQGDVQKGRSVRLAQSDLQALEAVQRMLARFGIASSIYQRRDAGVRPMPDGKGGMADYAHEAQHELVISKDNILRFSAKIGFYDPAKAAALSEMITPTTREPYAERFTAEVLSVTPDGEEEVFDCTVDEVHRFDANGLIVHNCGEISLSLLGAYCVIADLVPFHAETLDEAEEAFRVATRALMRVNLMDSLYKREVGRTNRIGVGITGVHEFAWKFFRVGFRDIVNPDFDRFHATYLGDEIGCGACAGHSRDPKVRAAAFWLTMARFSRAVQDEAVSYANELGVAVPHTTTTIKPAGTTSKLFGLTEGWHLPAMAQYLRWVQFRNDDPLVAAYVKAGYPTRSLKTYSGTTIIGFPTQPTIGSLGMGDALVTAAEATPEEQYKWLQLGEKFWIIGTDEMGEPLHAEGQDLGNQISYTLKYDPAIVGFAEFTDMLIQHQSQIRCCSVLPVADTSAYEYVPEQAISKAEYESLARAVVEAEGLKEEVGFEHVDCGAGACPVDFQEGEKAAPTVGGEERAQPVLKIQGETGRTFNIYGYSDGSCPWCEQAKELIEGRGHGLWFYDIKDQPWKDRFFAERQDIPRTVPQVFELSADGDIYIGGYTDLAKYLGVMPE